MKQYCDKFKSFSSPLFYNVRYISFLFVSTVFLLSHFFFIVHHFFFPNCLDIFSCFFFNVYSWQLFVYISQESNSFPRHTRCERARSSSRASPFTCVIHTHINVNTLREIMRSSINVPLHGNYTLRGKIYR